MRKWRERARSIVQKTLSQRKKIQPVKRLWKRVSNIGKNITDVEPISIGEVVVAVLIILTVVFLYVFNLFLEIGDWLNSITQLVSIILQWLSGFNFS